MGNLFDVYIDIHAIEAGNERGYHEDNREAGHTLHDGIDIVGDDGSKSIHCPGEDVAVNVYHIVRLSQLDHHVVE